MTLRAQKCVELITIECKAKLTVYTQAEYDTWLNEMQDRADFTTEKDKADLYWGWKWLADTKK